MLSIFYLILALLGLGLLVFIHELGHYYAARRVGMRVEIFSIGFGKALYSWERDGVKWQIGWLPFGGFVKIAGMERDDDSAPEQPDGFFGKRPVDRLIVAIMGPVFNLLLAFLIFTLIWVIGGRDKYFSELTQRAGWIDPQSELFQKGIRPGDRITKYNKNPVTGMKDHLYAAMTSDKEIQVEGEHYLEDTHESKPFSYTVPTYPHPFALEDGILTSGVLNSASYLIYDKLPNNQENALPEGSPMLGSGIQYGDRILWVNGDLLFSNQQLVNILNDGRSLLTVKRGDNLVLARVQRVETKELKFDSEHKEELVDWRHAANLQPKVAELFYIPYNLNDEGVVEGPLAFIDPNHHQLLKSDESIDAPLQVGDRIVAVDGVPVQRSFELLRQLQTRQVMVIVERGIDYSVPLNGDRIDEDFNSEVSWKDLDLITRSIGTSQPLKHSGNLFLLNPIAPLSKMSFPMPPEKLLELSLELKSQRKLIDKIEDPEKREKALAAFDQRAKQVVLGVPNVQDRHVHYNPSPIKLFADTFKETYTTLLALLSGYLNPKWLSGPIGIIQVIHHNWLVGFKEALFWMALISLNLGFLNLLPIPVLDGGYICLSLFEMITGKKVKAKTLEKIIVPFSILMIGLFIFLTFHDISRLVKMLIG